MLFAVVLNANLNKYDDDYHKGKRKRKRDVKHQSDPLMTMTFEKTLKSNLDVFS